MDIIVCVKQVPGTNKVEVDPVTGVLKRDGIASKLNPYDLFALESAFELRERFGGEVKTLSMGPDQAETALLETVWMGADQGMLLSDRAFAGSDVCATSYALSRGILVSGHYDLIICGKQTTDGDTAQVGPELAERLGLDHAANVLSIEQADEERITVSIDLDGIIQTQVMHLPCLITVDKDINTPRLPSYKRLKTTPDDCIKILRVQDLQSTDPAKLGLKGSPTKVERIFPPEKNTNKVVITGDAKVQSQKLFELLRDRRFI